MPVSLIGVSFSLAVFPTCRAAYAAGDRRRFARVVGRNLLTIGEPDDAVGVALFVVSSILVEVLLGGGEFGPEDVATTSAVVAAFALSVPFDALAYPLSRGLYATHDTLRQVIASFAGFGAVVVATRRSWSRSASSRSRSATPSGWRSRTSCWPSSSRRASAGSGGRASVGRTAAPAA